MNNKQKISFTCNRKLVNLTAFLFVLVYSTVFAQDRQVKIGTLALRGGEESVTRWTPTAEYLSDQISEHTFIIVPLDFEQIVEAVKNGDVEFVLGNSSIYVELEYLYGIDRIATLNVLCRRKIDHLFGGVIFIKKDRDDIKSIHDLKKKSFMAVHETSFGGWRMAQREFKDLEINPYKYFANVQFGNTHDNVVYAVQKGEVDAGTVRTGILERMNDEGKIDINDFTILNKQYPDNFSLLISTRLYPEWPFAKVKHTSAQLAKKVSLALLSIPIDNQAVQYVDIDSWAIPSDYQSVHDCLKELRVSPYEEYGIITLPNLIQQRWNWILFVFISILVLISVVVYVVRINRKINKSKERYRSLTKELAESNSVQESLISKLDAITSAAGDAIILLDEKKNIAFWNPAAERMFGYKSREVLNKNLHNTLSPERFRKVFEKAHKTFKNSGKGDAIGNTVELAGLKKSGEEFPIELSLSAFYQGNKWKAIGIIRDITIRKQFELNLQKSKERYRTLSEDLTESNSMKKLLLDVIAHDLKNPAGVIKGFAELGVEMDPDNEICKEIQKGTDNLLKVIDNASVISKVSAGDDIDKEAIDITEMIKTIAKEFSGQLGLANMKLDLKLKENIIVNANPIISEVFHNYISNAIKYASSGKKVIITAQEEDRILTINVIDHGDTISIKDQKNIFKRRVQLGKTSGSGLGLAIVNQIAKAHNAEVGVKSNSPKGNIFYLKIPRQ